MSYSIDPATDPCNPTSAAEVHLQFNGQEVIGFAGQSIAGALLSNGIESWRVTSVEGKPRGIFCGIGICYDCVAIVNGKRDVRLCQRTAIEGDAVVTQHDSLPGSSR